MTAWRLPLSKRRFVLNRRSTAPKQFVEYPSAQLQEFLVNLGVGIRLV